MPPLTILHADERVLVCAKPPGLLTVAPPKKNDRGEETLIARLRREGHGELFAVHRLDRETSGVVIVARDAPTRDALMEAFRARGVRKIYWAFVQGRPRPDSGTLSFPIKDLGAEAVIARDGQPAQTRYRTLEVLGPAAWLELELLTGRHNQARLHLAHIGHPLVGERKYARGRDDTVRHKRAALHAARLTLTLPGESEARTFEAPLSADLQNLLNKLGARPSK